jgi:hypothetical protein
VGYSGWGEVEVKGTVVDTGHIAGSTWLVLLWLESEGVNIHTGSWYVGVVLVWLYKVEIASVALGEAIVPVELNLGCQNRVQATVEEWGTSCVHKTVPTGYAEWLVVATPRKVASSRAASTKDILDHTRAEALVAHAVDLGRAFAH